MILNYFSRLIWNLQENRRMFILNFQRQTRRICKFINKIKMNNDDNEQAGFLFFFFIEHVQIRVIRKVIFLYCRIVHIE